MPLFTSPSDSIGYQITAMGVNHILDANWEPAYYSQLIDNGANSYISLYKFDVDGRNRINNGN